MSLVYSARYVAVRGTCLRSSYIEISRFLRPHHHGIKARAGVRSLNAVRCFTSSQQTLTGQDVLGQEDKLHKTLDDYKATSKHFL
jgi:aspartyl-tRNA synthetase